MKHRQLDKHNLINEAYGLQASDHFVYVVAVADTGFYFSTQSTPLRKYFQSVKSKFVRLLRRFVDDR